MRSMVEGAWPRPHSPLRLPRIKSGVATSPVNGGGTMKFTEPGAGCAGEHKAQYERPGG